MDLEERKRIADRNRVLTANANHTIVVGFSMPFGDMVIFLVKMAIAAIPAALILFIVGIFFVTFFSAFMKIAGI